MRLFFFSSRQKRSRFAAALSAALAALAPTRGVCCDGRRKCMDLCSYVCVCVCFCVRVWLTSRRSISAGFAETTLAEVLGKNGRTATLPLMKKAGRVGKATVSIRMDEVEHQHDLVTLKLRALNVRRTGGRGRGRGRLGD